MATTSSLIIIISDLKYSGLSGTPLFPSAIGERRFVFETWKSIDILGNKSEIIWRINSE